jgi:hypothetical protein
MEICIECGKPCGTGLVRSIGNGYEGVMHSTCVDKILMSHIAIRESDKPKAPTLEERVEIEIHACADDTDISRRIIAMVRAHDGASQKLDIRTHKQQVDQLSVVTKERDEWKDRAEKAEGKLAAIRSELST